jgi:release factor H-coupled RctB family protein
MHGRVGQSKLDLVRLARNPFGGILVCEVRGLMIEEAPKVYKVIGQEVDDLTHFGLARVGAIFRPMVTFKSVKAAAEAGRDVGARGCQARALRRSAPAQSAGAGL